MRYGRAILPVMLALTLPALAQPADSDLVDSWVVPPILAPGSRLPTPPGRTVHWTATGIALRDGKVLNTGPAAVNGQVTGTITLPGGRTVAKRFAVRVLGKDARWLLSYARTPTGARNANQPLIAHSVHLALGRSTRDAAPLNGNYGIVFARGDYIGVDRVALRGVRDPTPFHFADGSIGVIATRIALSGPPLGNRQGQAVLFRADRATPADFVELGVIDLPGDGPIAAPRALWDSAAARYVVSWTDNAGQPRWTTVQDLARTERVAAPFVPTDGGRRSRIVVQGNVGALRSGAIAAPDAIALPIADAERVAGLPIDATVATALADRFGRIVNTGASVAPRSITAGDHATLAKTRVRLSYSDGSTATRAVDWDEAEVRRLATAGPGTYRLHGVVRQRVYPQIFAYNRADPVIYRYAANGRTRYLFIATDDTDNNNVGSPHLPIRVADSIVALADAQGGRGREVDLLHRNRRDRTREGRVIAGCYWAPELHEISGRLTILFAPCCNPQDDQSTANPAWFTVEAHMMQLRPGGDPAVPADWSAPAAVRKADGSPLGRADFAGNISLDMSYLTLGGRSYLTWSQRYRDPAAMGDPLTWIARVDPRRPTRLSSAPAPIIAPDLSFEENLAEGAFAQIHDGRVHLLYSGSGVSPTYVVGGVWARTDADLTKIENWHKWSAPLQHSQPMPPGPLDYRTTEQGPGHGAFTTDEDGNTLYVYHTWGDGVGGNGRDTRVRRIHWAADGHPILDMMPEEEVAPGNRTVTMVVTVKPRR